MKRFLISVFAVAAALFATSCAQDGIDSSAVKGEEAVVTFAVNAPQIAGTRAFGDGKTANDLYYAVYNESNEVIEAISKMNNPEAIDISAQVKLRLVNGNTYSLIFWAENAAGVATVDWDAQTLTYAPTASSVEEYDAFWAYVEPFTVNGAATKNVDLYRPFAQVIIGAADYEAAVAAGLTAAETQIVVTTPSVMSLVDGATSAPVEHTYAYAALPNEEFPIANHKHMGMNYLLFGADKGMVDIKFEYKGSGAEYARNIPAVPVQRNFRTIIYGNLLTSQTDFNVKIVPDMQDIEHPLAAEYTAVSNLAEFQAALDAAVAGEETSIKFAANIEGNVNLVEKADATILIDGCGYEYDGTITFVGGSTYANANTQITNLNFVTETEKTFIYGDASQGSNRYVDNVTIMDCTFTATGAAEDKAVGAKLRSLKGEFNIIDCEATGLHTLVQTNSCGEGVVLVDNCVINGKNGVSFTNGTKSAKVANSTIVAKGYGVRSDARTANEALVIENCDITAKMPVVVRDLYNDGYSLTLAGSNDLAGEEYDIIFTNGDDAEAFAIPTGSYTVDGAEGFKVFPDNADELTVGGESATEAAAAFAAAMKSDATEVNVEAPIESKGLGFKIESDKKIDYDGQEFNAGSDPNSLWYALEVYGEETDVEIDNANFTRAGVAALDGAKVVFNSGTIDHNPERTSRYIFLAGGQGSTITINDGTFLNDRAKNRYFYAYDGGIIYVKGGNFGGVASTNKLYLANGGQLIISGGTFNFDPTEWLADGYVAVKSGSTWTVQAE